MRKFGVVELPVVVLVQPSKLHVEIAAPYIDIGVLENLGTQLRELAGTDSLPEVTIVAPCEWNERVCATR